MACSSWWRQGLLALLHDFFFAMESLDLEVREIGHDEVGTITETVEADSISPAVNRIIPIIVGMHFSYSFLMN